MLNASFWTAAPLRLAADGQNTTLLVDLSKLGLGSVASPSPLAVRYGWPLSKGGDTCCPFAEVKNGTAPCVPGSCPIITAQDSLPANPWYATLSSGGKCSCQAPQKCDGTAATKTDDRGATSSSTPDVWYGPNPFSKGAALRPDFFSNVSHPETQWPQLAKKVTTFKIFLDMLYTRGCAGCSPTMGSTDAQLRSLIAVLKARGIKTGIEVGGARWGAGRCDAKAALAYAAIEQKQVGRWLQLGGEIDSLTTDHADVWNVRGLSGPPCVPAVPMATRIDIVAQVFASWRTFLGPTASLGFIESLGFWEITGPDGTNFSCTDPAHLDKVAGWIPRLDDVTRLLLEAAAKHNPTPERTLVDHYFLDFSLEGVEYDTRVYGTAPPVGVNYNRVLGAERIMHRHGLKTGIFLNAFAAKSLNCSAGGSDAECSASASERTLNYTRGYMQLPSRQSEHAVLEQWQPFPSKTGPETAEHTAMWMGLQAAQIIQAGGGEI